MGRGLGVGHPDPLWRPKLRGAVIYRKSPMGQVGKEGVGGRRGWREVSKQFSISVSWLGGFQDSIAHKCLARKHNIIKAIALIPNQ
jgi:hypothetical protein